MNKLAIVMRLQFGAFLLILVPLLLWLGPVCKAAEQTPASSPAKIDLKILYAGNPGSQREADFLAFLAQHFTQVKSMDLTAFTGKESGFDVVILDPSHDKPVEPLDQPPQIRLADSYSRPTILVGAPGELMLSQFGLKTGYM